MFIGQLLVCSMFVGNVDSFVCLIYACVTEFSSSGYMLWSLHEIVLYSIYPMSLCMLIKIQDCQICSKGDCHY
jgi:hypothetical protein